MNLREGQPGAVGHEAWSAVPAGAAPAMDGALLISLTAAQHLHATLVFLRRALSAEPTGAAHGGVRLMLSGDGRRCLEWPNTRAALERLRAQGLRIEVQE